MYHAFRFPFTAVSDSDGDSGSDDDRKRRQINNDAEEEEKDEPDTPDQNDNKDKLQSQRVLPLPKGVGKNAKTGGQTVFTYNEKVTVIACDLETLQMYAPGHSGRCKKSNPII